MSRYHGPPRLIRATGTEEFDTVAGGEAIVERPDPGEVVWCDDQGSPAGGGTGARRAAPSCVTTPPRPQFVLDALDPLTDEP